MGFLPSVFGNAHSKTYPLLTLVAFLGFLLGMLTSPLLQSNNASPSSKPPALLKPVNPSSARQRGRVPSDLLTFPSTCQKAVPLKDVRSLLLAKIYDGVSPFEGFPPDYAKPWLSEKKVLGWGSNDPVFARLITEAKPRIILELGSFLGASATHMATVSKSQGREALVICVDDFRGWPGFREEFKLANIHGDVQLLYQFLQNVKSLNLTQSILPIPFSTTAVMYTLCQWGVYADLIEVDAGHDFHSAWTDINFAYMVLKPGGVMFGDDYYNAGVGKAVDLFAELNELRVEPDGRHWILRNR